MRNDLQIGDICAVTVVLKHDRPSHLVELIGISGRQHIFRPLHKHSTYGKNNGPLKEEHCIRWGIDKKHIGCRWGLWSGNLGIQGGDSIFPTAVFRKS